MQRLALKDSHPEKVVKEREIKKKRTEMGIFGVSWQNEKKKLRANKEAAPLPQKKNDAMGSCEVLSYALLYLPTQKKKKN